MDDMLEHITGAVHTLFNYHGESALSEDVEFVYLGDPTRAGTLDVEVTELDPVKRNPVGPVRRFRISVTEVER